MNWTRVSSLLTILLMAVPSFGGYFKSTEPSAHLDPNKRTHVLVTGRGNDLGEQPMIAASSKAKKIAEAFPDDQILFISAADSAANGGDLMRMGFQNIQFIHTLLDSKALMDEMSAFHQIASFNVYGHSAIPEGLFLDAVGDHDVRWYPWDQAPLRLAGHFTDDAFATLNGCNGGQVMASILSKMWGIPVAGALTGSHFEALFQDGNFYYAEQKDSAKFAKDTLHSLAQKSSCRGACLRMRPDNADYNSHYGKYLQGLPFYKFFCVGIEKEKCLKGMALSVFAIVSNQTLPSNASYEMYAAVVREWICPTGQVGDPLQKNCIDALEKIDISNLQAQSPERFYSPFGGRSAQCNFTSCYEAPRCLNAKNTMSCAEAVNSPERGHSTTFVDEYLNYLRGYALLARNP